MRYPRFFFVLFVALGLAALPAADTHATDAGHLPDSPRQIGTPSDVSPQASTGVDLIRRGRAVDLLARRADLDHDEAGLLLGAVTDFVASIIAAGERAGVLARPEIDTLLDVVLSFAGSADPRGGQTSGNGALNTVRGVPATEFPLDDDRTTLDTLLSLDTASAVDPVERWRPLVEQYFSAEWIEEALSIIDCESNGDPDARNPSSSASGLFQFLGRTWSYSSEQAGFQDESPFSPEANIAAAAWLVEYSLSVGDPAWAHWTCRP